jgi:hypothetical protein
MTVVTASSRNRGTPVAIFAAALGFAALQAAQPCVADDVSPMRAYFYFVHWVSMGRADLASEQFADDAVVIAGPDCTLSAPCIGRVAIRDRYIKSLGARRTPLPLQDQRFDGQSLRTHGETILEQEPGRGVARLLGGHVFDFRGGRISSLRVELDRSDPATAAFLERREGETALTNR